MKEKIKIKRLQPDDLKIFTQLIEVLNEVFQEYNSIATNKHLQKLLAKPEFYAIVAIIDDCVVGGLTAYELKKYYNDKSELYIYDIAVKNKLHNQGIGKRLIQFLKEYSLENSIETLFVEAHSEDDQAVKFYQSTFGISEKVDHFNFEIKTTANK